MRTVAAAMCDRDVTIELSTPGVDGLNEVVGALREWQYDGAPMQLHPGDLGWFWRFGAEATAAAVRRGAGTGGSSPSGCWTIPGCCGWRSRRRRGGTRNWRGGWSRT